MRALALSDGWVAVADAPAFEPVGESQRSPASSRGHDRVCEDLRQRARELRADGLTLREVAAAVGVSHETVRAILREPENALAAD